MRSPLGGGIFFTTPGRHSLLSVQYAWSEGDTAVYVRGGLAFGATDELGLKAVENPVHVHDLHATILHLLGLDHEKLTYRYAGRDYRLTDVHGRVLHDILS